MSAHIGNLKDENGDTFYPITKTNAVLDENNVDVGTRLNNINTAVNNLENAVSNRIEKVTRLWSNSNLGHSFNAQTINLSDNLSNYDYVIISFRQWTTVESVTTQFFRPFLGYNVSQELFWCFNSLSDRQCLIRSRAFTILSNGTQITFDNGTTSVDDTISTSAYACVPYAIFGINLMRS